MPRPEARALSTSELLLSRARHMRRHPTPSEALLGSAVRGRALGVKLRRQHVVGASFIVDLAAPSARLVVEVDGAVHSGWRAAQDARRDEALARLGWRVVRVKAWMVERHLAVVLEVLRAALA